MKAVASKGLGTRRAKSLQMEELSSPSYTMPLSDLAMNLREKASAFLWGMGENLGSSFVPPPSSRNTRFYRLEGSGFLASLSDLVNPLEKGGDELTISCDIG